MILGGSYFEASTETYDWLGSGIYFWENDPVRAYQWAAGSHRAQANPSVVGVVIDLGRCLDLTTQEGKEAVRAAYEGLRKLHAIAEQPLPKNTFGPDKVKRHLDCAVINHLHRARRQLA